jgi:uncharacterized delta-60 repeat protein
MSVTKYVLIKLIIVIFIISFAGAAKAGILDSGFLPTLTVPGRTNVVARQADGKIIVAGIFTAINSSVVNNLSRINPDGTVDASFNSGFGANAPVNSLLIQPDGKIIIGGEFTRFNGQARNHLVRLNQDGSVDMTFTAGVGDVYSLALQSDGKILVGGNFNSLVVRLNSNGSMDNTFTSNTSGFGGNVFSLAVQADQKILVGGTFSQFSNGTASNLVRLNQNGSVDMGFNMGNGPNNGVAAINIQPDGKIVIGGSFTLFRGSATAYLARVNPDGSIDTVLPSGPNNSVSSLDLQPDGKIVVGGFFTNFGATARNRILRLNADFTFDTTFNPNGGFDNVVRDVLVDGGSIVVAGSFASFDSTPRFGLARLSTSGGVSPDFRPSVGLPTETYVVKPLPDGKIIVGGDFEMVNGQRKPKLARLNIDGTVDASFTPPVTFNGAVRTIDLQPDGKILLGAVSFQVNNVFKYVIRLNQDGSLDQTFNTSIPADNIAKVKYLSNGKILVGGTFDTVDGVFRKIWCVLTLTVHWMRLSPPARDSAAPSWILKFSPTGK